MRDPFTVEELAQPVDVLADGLDLVVLLGRDVPRQHVHDAFGLWELRRDLLGEEEVGAVDEREPAGDRVVVRECDQGHTAGLAELVLADWIRVALRASEEARVPLVVTGRGRRM